MSHQKIRFRNFVKGLKIGGTGSTNRNHLSEECSIGKLMNMISGMYCSEFGGRSSTVRLGQSKSGVGPDVSFLDLNGPTI